MKFAAILFLIVSAWAELKVIYEFPEWWAERSFGNSMSQPVESRYARIFGGQETTPNLLPFQVGLLLFMNNSVDVGFCSGSLATPNRVITAAHCVDVVVGIQAVFGAHFIDRLESSQTRVAVRKSELAWHENYDPKNIQNDIAMISLTTPIVLSDIIQVIALPQGNDLSRDFSGEAAVVSGWGRFSSSLALSKTLRFVEVTVIKNKDCRQFFPTRLRDDKLCTSANGAGDKNVGTCNSDSGGPLTVKINGTTTLIGIASFVTGRGCDMGFPSGFVRVTSYIKWIHDRL